MNLLRRYCLPRCWLSSGLCSSCGKPEHLMQVLEAPGPGAANAASLHAQVSGAETSAVDMRDVITVAQGEVLVHL